MRVSRTPTVAGTAQLPNGTYSVPERDLAMTVVRDALDDADVAPSAVDGLYMPSPRPWTDQKFFSTAVVRLLGIEADRTLEVSTGGTSGGKAFQAAVADVRSGAVDTALVFAVERNSTVETTGPYFEYILRTFESEFESPIGMSIPGIYAQSMQRYCHEYAVARDDLADIVVKNRDNAAGEPETLFESSVTRSEVLESRPIADPIRVFECPAPCDGAAAIVMTGDPEIARNDTGVSVTIAGIGSHHAASHHLASRHETMTELPAVRNAASEASAEADRSRDEIDVYEPYAPFPHIEAIVTEELGLVDRGEGVDACLDGRTAPDGEFPISPSGGCLGRGHPPMVTPLHNYVEAVRQIEGTASSQVPDVTTVMTTAEHGHVNGVTATVFERGDC